MADIVSPEVRSRIMSRIRSKNTGPELVVRRLLHARGFRYRLHVRNLPGKPDIVFPRYSAAVFVSGCFWHGHDCSLFRMPKTRPQFWATKIERNRANDRSAIEKLGMTGWRCITVWECSLRDRRDEEVDSVADAIAQWLRHGASNAEIKGGTGICVKATSLNTSKRSRPKH